MNEIWRPTHHPFYEVSNFGRVRSIEHEVVKKSRRGKTHTWIWRGKILSQKTRQNGYAEVNFSGGGSVLVHRLVATAFATHPHVAHHEVHHIDGDALNNFAGNLKWVTRAENMAFDTPKMAKWRNRAKQRARGESA